MSDSLRKKLALPSLNQRLQLPRLKPLSASLFRGGAAGEPPLEPPNPPQTPSLAGAGWTPPLDLLREKRQELGVEPVSGLLMQQPALLRRGLVFGGLILGASLGVCGFLLIWHQLLKGRMGQLERYEGDVEQLTKTLQGHRAALKKVNDSNNALVKRITNVRSSSALLADLQLRAPEGLQLLEVEMKDSDGEAPDELRLKGLARDPVPFGRVNAMELVLRESPLVAAKGVTLGKVERLAPQVIDLPRAGGGATGTTKLQVPSAVQFEMTAMLTPLEGNRLLAVMEGLQAEGMTRRLALLQREGLLK
jgi:type IV pilus assembly protein PilN